MGRRLPRRMWHSIAALVPLPLIGLGYIAAVPGNPVAFQIELFLAGKGSEQALTRQAEAAPQRLPREAALLFRAAGKGPRADQHFMPSRVTSAGKQLIAASLTGDPATTGALWRRSEVNGAIKGDRLKPTSSAVALTGSISGADTSLLMSAASFKFRCRSLPAFARGDRLSPDPRGTRLPL